MVNERFMAKAREWINPEADVKALEADIKKRAEEKKAQVHIAVPDLARQKGSNILTLESKVEFSKSITNEVELEAEGQKVKYVGYAEELHFDGNAIRGRARLRRYDLKEKVITQRKRVSWFPPRTKIEEVRSQEWIKRWGVTSGEYNSQYFLNNGKPQTGYDCSADYRAALKGSAANEGVALSHELFESVFGPIDAKILEMYQKFYVPKK